jgi:hypothetical protein
LKFNDEQLRVAANLRQYYDLWLETRRGLAELNYSLSWKTKGSVEYLRRRSDSSDTTMGARSPETEAIMAKYEADKAMFEEQDDARTPLLFATCRQYVALRMGIIASAAAAILRAADIRGYLGSALVVVGTNAMAAYELEASARFALGMDATEDFDLAWAVGDNKTVLALSSKAPVSLLSLLKSVDSTYTVNTERTFQARNKDAYEVELLVAPSRVETLPRTIGFAPIPMPEQEWLLQGRPVDQVVCGRDKTPARIVAPDPRWFAVHKLWMAEKPQRNPLKKPKDRNQGTALLKAVQQFMPHYPLDDDFCASLPPDLVPHFDTWMDEHGKKSARLAKPF